MAFDHSAILKRPQVGHIVADVLARTNWKDNQGKTEIYYLETRRLVIQLTEQQTVKSLNNVGQKVSDVQYTVKSDETVMHFRKMFWLLGVNTKKFQGQFILCVVCFYNCWTCITQDVCSLHRKNKVEEVRRDRYGVGGVGLISWQLGEIFLSWKKIYGYVPNFDKDQNIFPDILFSNHVSGWEPLSNMEHCQ